MVSPVCTGKRFWGLEKAVGWVAVTGGRVRPGGKQVRAVLWRAACLPGWPLAVGPKDRKLSRQREGMSMGRTGQVWHFLGQPCTREAQPENAAPGWEEDVPAALCLLQEPAQPRAVVGN